MTGRSKQEKVEDFSLPEDEELVQPSTVHAISGLVVALGVLGISDLATDALIQAFNGLGTREHRMFVDALLFTVRTEPGFARDARVGTTMTDLLLSLNLPGGIKRKTFATMPAPNHIETVGGAEVTLEDGATRFEFRNGSVVHVTADGFPFKSQGTVPLLLHYYNCDSRGGFVGVDDFRFSVSTVLAMLKYKPKTPPAGFPTVHQYMVAVRDYLHDIIPPGIDTLQELDKFFRAKNPSLGQDKFEKMRVLAIRALMNARGTVAARGVTPQELLELQKIMRVFRAGHEDAGKTNTGLMSDSTVTKQLALIDHFQQECGLKTDEVVHLLGSGDAHISCVLVKDPEGNVFSVKEHDVKVQRGTFACDALANPDQFTSGTFISDMLFSKEMDFEALHMLLTSHPARFGYKTAIDPDSKTANTLANFSGWYKLSVVLGGRGHNPEVFLVGESRLSAEDLTYIAQRGPEERKAFLEDKWDKNEAFSAQEINGLLLAILKHKTDNSILRTIAMLEFKTQGMLGSNWRAYAEQRGGQPKNTRSYRLERLDGKFHVVPFDVPQPTHYTIMGSAAFTVPLDLPDSCFLVTDDEEEGGDPLAHVDLDAADDAEANGFHARKSKLATNALSLTPTKTMGVSSAAVPGGLPTVAPKGRGGNVPYPKGTTLLAQGVGKGGKTDEKNAPNKGGKGQGRGKLT